MDRITATGLAKTFDLKPGQFAEVEGRREGRVTVLDGFDVAVRRGEFLTLVGPSGSGKSVFLDIVAGLTAATGGEARIDGEAIRRPDPRMAYVFQQYALFPWRTALENVEYALEVRGAAKAERRRRARHFLSLFGLGGFEDRYPSQLSGGMQQRVAIARALSTEPEVLLMDEPFAALDAQTRDLLQTELLRIWERTDATVVFVTHAIDEAVYLADRIVAMTARPGRVKEIIDVPLARPRDPEVRGTPAFAALRAQVWEVLRDEVSRAQKDWGLVAPTH